MANEQGMTPQSAHNALVTIIALYSGILADQDRLASFLRQQLINAAEENKKLQHELHEARAHIHDLERRITQDESSGR